METQAHTLLVCDLDGTLIPAAPGPDAIHAAAIVELRTMLAEVPGLKLACATGRNLDSALQELAAWNMPVPDLLCCDVGTSVHVRVGGAWRRDSVHDSNMSTASAGGDASCWREVLAGIPDLIPQAAAQQSRWKASYLLPDGKAGEVVLIEVERRLAANGPRPSLVRSRGVRGEGALLDVLPPGITKVAGLRRMAAKCGLTLAQVVYAGDSGNDTEALLEAGRAILVGNAPQALKDLVSSQRADHADSVFIASSCDLAGVLAGCRHFGLTLSS